MIRTEAWSITALALGISLATATAQPAIADEIRYYDPLTCEPTAEQVADIVEENWATTSYRVKAGQNLKRVDTRLVIDIRRTAEDSQILAFKSALAEFQSGNWAGARQGFGTVAGGGLTQDSVTGEIKNKPFPAPEGGKVKWYVPYTHFFYAASIYREGLAKKDDKLLEFALEALDADTAEAKGFLARYKEGKSRYYADAMLLKAQVLLALKRYDLAAAAFDALYQKSLTVPMGVRFSSESKLGPGRIAEAKGEGAAAEAAYEAASAAVLSLLDQPQDACSRRELGRLYNEARMQKARIMLAAAEKADSPPEFARLRTYLQAGSPEALRTKLTGRPPEVIDAVLGGALSPTVQALANNGIGLALLSEKKYADAVFAFTNVRIKYFSVADEVPRALYYLAKAADLASAAATKPDAKTLFKDQATAARAELERAWKDTPWATMK